MGVVAVFVGEVAGVVAACGFAAADAVDVVAVLGATALDQLILGVVAVGGSQAIFGGAEGIALVVVAVVEYAVGVTDSDYGWHTAS